MKFTINWLYQYIDFDLSAQELADRLTMAGLEVDAVDELYPDLSGIVVARIVSVTSHPNADRLVVCRVDDGVGERQVVCGAPNARAGMITALATPGTMMPGGFKIKPSKIRGESSDGMLCSASELGIGGGKEGIMDLAEGLIVGQPLTEALELSDTLVEVDLTPNRPDCASVIGLAREVGGFTGGRMHPPVTEDDSDQGQGCSDFTVEVLDSTACPRYAARLIRGVTIGPSPWWLQRLLLAVGLRPINNVVDITNFVMLEYGQPLHAFDFGKLAGGTIRVRKAVPDEKLTTLDGVERELDSEMLLICDGAQPVAVAGVMGGGNSEVDSATVDILLESACFDPVSVRRTARQLKLSTDSSYRFERGVDPLGCGRALARATQLVLELAGGASVPGGVDLKGGLRDGSVISLRAERCSSLLGMPLTTGRIKELLESIEIFCVEEEAQPLLVTPPSFRVDLEREVDLIEEVARLIGYNDIPISLPTVPLNFSEKDPDRILRQRVARLMTAQGFNEAINYSFVSPRHFDQLGLADDDGLRQTVRLMNPLGEDQSVMRTMLLPGLLDNLKRNINHQTPDIRLFEIGKVFHPGDAPLPTEEIHLSAVHSGRKFPGSPVYHFGHETVDFYDIKAAITGLLDELRLADVAFVANGQVPVYGDSDLCLALVVDGKSVGFCGRMLPEVLRKFGIKTDVYVCEVNLTALEQASTRPKVFKQLAKFPSVRWDLAMLVPSDIPGESIINLIKEAGGDIFERCEIFDVYQGKNIDSGWKSIAVAITYRSSTQTLDDVTVGQVHQKVIDLIGARCGGKLREG
ncbi:MAG: phenylalanine--tRNA ligase subunit beta [Proteobacteria bacterium]|nr:phenylalanine--tRNA ligase subunit beta [Pseudomonadota bacterium]MBU1688360.1 phenylalanine--tRNA ligase subunit beta [Pseudomonadota bacterium]